MAVLCYMYIVLIIIIIIAGGSSSLLPTVLTDLGGKERIARLQAIVFLVNGLAMFISVPFAGNCQ